MQMWKNIQRSSVLKWPGLQCVTVIYVCEGHCVLSMHNHAIFRDYLSMFFKRVRGITRGGENIFLL